MDEKKKAAGQPSSFLSETHGTRGENLGLFWLSAGVLAHELLLMRLFSVLMWYHFASLAIALALLGLGAGGGAVGLAAKLRHPSWARRGAWGFALGTLLFLVFLLVVRVEPEFARVTIAPFHQPFYQPFARAETLLPGWSLTWRLGALAVLAGLPFFGAGLATAGILARRAPKVHRPYAATFLGSALGAAATPAALSVVGAPAALTGAAALGFLGAAFLSRRRRAFAMVAALSALALGGWVQATGSAELPFARGRYDRSLLAVRWNPMSRVAAYSLAGGDLARPFGLSRTHRGPGPRQIGLVVDDSGYTNLFDGREARDDPEYFRANLVSLPWHLRPGAKALVIGPGGGKDVWVGLSFPESTITAVEINPQVVEMVEEVFAPFTGQPYRDPRVTLTVANARRFIARDTDRYDVIEASAVFGRLPPAAGAFTLSEDLLHTREAFRAYWDHLTDRGILSVSLFAYENRALRLAALARDLLDRLNIDDPGAHVRVVSDRGFASLLLCRSPFTTQDDRQLAEQMKALRFRYLFPPEDGPTALSRILSAPSLEEVLADLKPDVSPPTDDRPFFYYTLRPADLWNAGRGGRPAFDNQGARILRAALTAVLALTFVALLVPTALIRGRPDSRGVAPLLFALAVGAGYMALEIGTMKRFTLFLGHPVYAVSATLFAFLLGGGLGSLAARRWVTNRKSLATAVVVACALGVFQALAVPGFLARIDPAGTTIRWLLAAGMILPLAFVLGMPFPSALARLGPSREGTVSWCWAVNGAASVVGSLGAVLVAMNWGYTVTLLAGVALYATALCAVPGLTLEASR